MTIVVQGNEKVSETIQDKWCHCKRHIRLTILVGLLILLKVDRSWHVKKGTQPHWNVKECASQGRRYILRLGTLKKQRYTKLSKHLLLYEIDALINAVHPLPEHFKGCESAVMAKGGSFSFNSWSNRNLPWAFMLRRL
jgi:hypothetical protein